jgi:hypothetical protein
VSCPVGVVKASGPARPRADLAGEVLASTLLMALRSRIAEVVRQVIQHLPCALSQPAPLLPFLRAWRHQH